MIRLFDYAFRFGQYILFAVLLVFGTIAFLNDTCAIAASSDVQWSSNYLRWIADAVYRAAQLFVLEFNRACEQPELANNASWSLDIARFAALLFFAGAIVTFLVPRATRRLLIATQARLYGRRAIVLGYGPVGQGIARELATRARPRQPSKTSGIWGRLRRRLLTNPLLASIDRWWRKGRLVTVIQKDITPAQTETAKRDNILLVEGDPSDPRLHRAVKIQRSSCVLAAVGSDMQTLDAAVSARKSLSQNTQPIRVLLSDQELAANLANAASHGFLGATDVQGFSLATEAARLLIAEARFDRTALEKKQQHVHLLIIGCGAQGEAVAIETLLTAWRTDLGPPTVSIFDRSSESVRERFKRRAPAFFPEENEPPLPRSTRVQVNFEFADIETLDFASPAIVNTLSKHGPATAWVFAAGDDSLNLRGAAALHLAMLKKQIAPAPIHVRIWSGHQGDTPILSAHPVSLARAFGALETTLAATPACDENPDQIAEQLHGTYLEQGRRMAQADPGFHFTELPWSELPETLRNANRRLHRHAVMKFEDLGGQWRQRGRAVPVVDPELRDPYVRAEDQMNYDAMNTDTLPKVWWKERAEGRGPEDDKLARRAQAILNVAITEHSRWVTDRAMDGWRPTFAPDRAVRDNIRRYHPNMCDWSLLDANTRRWDAVLLRALIVGEEGRDLAVSAWKRRVSSVVLATRAAVFKKHSNVPNFRPECRFVPIPQGSPLDAQPTELRIVIAGEPRRSDLAATIESARQVLAGHLARPGSSSRLCRVRFDFFAPPGECALALANALGSAVAGWTPPGTPASASSVVEVSSLWDWADTPSPVLGFIGHRDLERMNGADGLDEFLESFFAALLSKGLVSGLVSGYAPGADRIAVNSWISLGAPKPVLFFPYAAPVTGENGEHQRAHLTDAGASKGSPEWVGHDEIAELAGVRQSRKRPRMDPHRSQATDILESAEIIAAVFDGKGSSGKGSVGDTIERAKKLGKQVILIDRDHHNKWRHRHLDDVEHQ